MDWKILILRQSILLIIAVMGWLSAAAAHRKCRSSSEEALRVPRLIGVLFGSSRQDGIINYRSALLQLVLYISVPAITMLNVGIISRGDLAKIVGWSSVVLFLLSLVVFFVKGRR
jgi:hypothetical protein